MSYTEIINFTILSIGNYSLHVYNVLSVVIIFLVTKILLLIIKRFIIKKDSGDSSHYHSVFKIIKYVLWVIAITVMLQSAAVNLSIFLAGSAALLVGVGLGLQQIFNDLISGFFILFERNIRVGDIMEVDGMVGKVEDIRLRSTEILSRDGMNIIVPNHKFITENVINWSHNNLFKRFKIDIGVAYGSNLDKVKELLLRCASDHPEVINNSDEFKPMVRLVDFADSSIDFELLFWSYNIFRIENTRSDLRFAIDKIFKENQITIPFPQRDIHIKDQINGQS